MHSTQPSGQPARGPRAADRPGTPLRPPVWDLTAWRSMYPGMWAWVLQRASALVLLVLFPFHVMNPYIAWLRLTVLALVIWHGMHGLKVILTDFGFPDRHHRKLMWALIVVGVVGFIWLAYLRKSSGSSA